MGNAESRNRSEAVIPNSYLSRTQLQGHEALNPRYESAVTSKTGWTWDAVLSGDPLLLYSASCCEMLSTVS